MLTNIFSILIHSVYSLKYSVIYEMLTNLLFSYVLSAVLQPLTMGQIFLIFPRPSYSRQKWAMVPFQEPEEKVQVAVPCSTGGGYIQKFTKSLIPPLINN